MLSFGILLAACCPVFAQADDTVHPPASSLIDFDETGHVQADPGTQRAAKLQLDAFAAFTPTDPDVRLGIGAVLWKNATWRAAAGPLNGGAGALISYRLVPVVDLSVGAGAMYRISDDHVLPFVSVSMANW